MLDPLPPGGLTTGAYAARTETLGFTFAAALTRVNSISTIGTFVGAYCVGYSIEWRQRDCVVRYTDKVAFSDLLAAVTTIHADPDFSLLKRVVHDVSAAAEVDPTSIDLSVLASHELGARFTNPALLIAVVSDREDIVQFAKCFNALTRLDIPVFPDHASMQRWLEQTRTPHRDMPL